VYSRIKLQHEDMIMQDDHFNIIGSISNVLFCVSSGFVPSEVISDLKNRPYMCFIR